jgi:hypothetical protein
VCQYNIATQYTYRPGRHDLGIGRQASLTSDKKHVKQDMSGRKLILYLIATSVKTV